MRRHVNSAGEKEHRRLLTRPEVALPPRLCLRTWRLEVDLPLCCCLCAWPGVELPPHRHVLVWPDVELLPCRHRFAQLEIELPS